MPLDAMRDKIKAMEALIDDQAGTISIFNYEIEQLEKIVKERDKTIAQLRSINNDFTPPVRDESGKVVTMKEVI